MNRALSANSPTAPVEDLQKCFVSKKNKKLEAALIVSTQSGLASSIVLVPEKDCILQICVDYWSFSTTPISDTFQPLPIDECIDSLGKAQVLTVVDALERYLQIPIKYEDIYMTTFTFTLVPLHLYAIWLTKRTRYVPMCVGYYPI